MIIHPGILPFIKTSETQYTCLNCSAYPLKYCIFSEIVKTRYAMFKSSNTNQDLHKSVKDNPNEQTATTPSAQDPEIDIPSLSKPTRTRSLSATASPKAETPTEHGLSKGLSQGALQVCDTHDEMPFVLPDTGVAVTSMSYATTGAREPSAAATQSVLDRIAEDFRNLPQCQTISAVEGGADTDIKTVLQGPQHDEAIVQQLQELDLKIKVLQMEKAKIIFLRGPSDGEARAPGRGESTGDRVKRNTQSQGAVEQIPAPLPWPSREQLVNKQTSVLDDICDRHWELTTPSAGIDSWKAKPEPRAKCSPPPIIYRSCECRQCKKQHGRKHNLSFKWYEPSNSGPFDDDPSSSGFEDYDSMIFDSMYYI